MDTKWRRFSRSRAVKVLLVVLYMICFGAAGIVWGYTVAYDYVSLSHKTYGFDALLSDDFRNSEYLADIVMADMDTADDIFDYSMPDWKIPYNVAKLDYLCMGRQDSLSVSNDYCARNYSLRFDKNGVSGDLNYGRIAERAALIYDYLEYQYSYLSPKASLNNYVEIGYSDDIMGQMSDYWYEMRRNMFIVVVTEAVLVIVGIALLALSCAVMGESSEGASGMRNIWKLPVEIAAALFVLCGIFAVYPLFGVIDGSTAFHLSFNGRVLYMLLCGVATLITFMLLWYLCVSHAVRRKNGCALKYCLLYHVVRFAWFVLKKLWAGLKLFVGFVKEIFTGELYTTKTAARKLLIMDVVFALFTVFMVTFIVLCLDSYVNRDMAILWIILEALALAALLYGRYLILRDGAILEAQIKRMHSGTYAANPLHNMSKNSPYKESSVRLTELSEQYRRSIEESLKAERMKLELVTNVSHDLKTPLTSIIGYIELLSKEELTGDAAEYVEILQSKSERLKNIVSDVFELAKTTSGEITVEKEPIDLAKLSYQTLGEMEDKITDSGLEVKANICEPPVTIVSDGKRLYRVIQNLLDNALKYSLKGTRIYYSLEKRDSRAYIIIKNISAYEMTFTKDEIMERFTRGDKARSTEGTGLGLSIAQGFTLACGGMFDIDIDGDMFKAILSFPLSENTKVNTDG